MADIYIHFYHT